MKKKSYGMVLMSILLVGTVVGWMTFNTGTDPQPAVEYRAVCRNLPANAHWTDGSTRKKIPQTETSSNVREPSPVGTYDASGSDTECHFVCDGGYVRQNGVCEASEGITYDPVAGTITITDSTTTYTIMDKNLGATVAGTGKLNGQDGCTTSDNGTTCWSESIGDYFQRGNNYGFANSGKLLATTSTRPNASGYGPNNPYSSSTFITTGSDWPSNKNDNLRGGGSDTQANGRDSGNARTERQGPCPNGYHIPSAGEWSGLVMARWNTIGSGGNTISISSGLPYFSSETKATAFRNDFLFPLAGNRNYDSSATVYYQGFRSYYWSSSPNSSNARNLYLNTSSVLATTSNHRSYGFSLRCFKNS